MPNYLLRGREIKHLYSLISTDEFDPSWVLRSFRNHLRVPVSIEKGPQSPTSFELEELRKRVSDLRIERDELEHRLGEKEVKATSSEGDSLQQQVTLLTLSKKKAEKAATEARAKAEAAENRLLCSQVEAKNKVAKARAHAEDTEKRLLCAQTEAEKVTEARKEVEEVRKDLETSEREHRVADSERNLLRDRWMEEKAKTSAMAQEIDTLKLTLDLERDTRDTIPVAVRDELKQALKAEQSEVKKLNMELERALQAATNARG